MAVMQFSRTVAPETSKGPALIALMRHYEWAKVVIWSSQINHWPETGLELTRQFEAANIKVFKPQMFDPNSFQAGILREIKHSGENLLSH